MKNPMVWGKIQSQNYAALNTKKYAQKHKRNPLKNKKVAILLCHTFACKVKIFIKTLSTSIYQQLWMNILMSRVCKQLMI